MSREIGLCFAPGGQRDQRGSRLLLSRREFVFTCACMAGAKLTRRSILATESAEIRRAARPLVVGVALPGSPGIDQANVAKGVRLGIAEAARAALLFGRSVRSTTIVSDTGVIRANVARAKREDVQVVVSALNYSATAQLVDACDASGIVVINAMSRSNAFRRDRCSPMFFHVEASDAMYSMAAERTGADDSEIALWSSRLEKYGAAQLNDRFASMAKVPMTSSSWAGWAATKIAWESFLRSSEGDAASIARHMAADASQFDCHKGAPLSFRSWDHQLRQPLYTVSRNSGKVNAEVPDTSRPSADIRTLLDTIGDAAGTSSCNRRAS